MWWLPLALILIIYLICTLPYYTGAYFRGTHLPYLRLRFHKGMWGEYRLFRAANRLSGRKAWLFNLYLPKQDRATTEVDAVLIHESGVYVFESKNLCGRIDGAPDARDWQLTAPGGQAYLFYNPMLQNQTHCDYVQRTIPRALIYSIIVFGKDTALGSLPTEHGAHHICTIEDLPTLLAELSTRIPHQHGAIKQTLIEAALTPFAHPPHFAKLRHKETILRQKQRHAEKDKADRNLL